MNNITIPKFVCERYFNDAEQEVSTDEIVQQSTDDNINVYESLHLNDSKYNYILNVILYSEDYSRNTIIKVLNVIKNELDNHINVYEYVVKPTVIAKRRGIILNKEVIEDIDWELSSYQDYNMATIPDKNVDEIDIIVPLYGNFKNAKYMANLYYLILRELYKDKLEAYANIHINNSKDLYSHEHQFLSAEDFKKKDMFIISKAIKDEIEDKQTYYHISSALYKNNYPVHILYSVMLQTRECFDYDGDVYKIDITNLNKEALYDLFYTQISIDL